MISHRLWILLLYKKCKKTVEKVEDGNVLKQVLLSENDLLKNVCLQKLKMLMGVVYMLLSLLFYLSFLGCTQPHFFELAPKY